MAGRAEYEMMFQLQAQLGGQFNSAFAKAQQQLVAMQKQIQSLSKTQGNISAYQKQQSALEATRQKLVTLQQQYDNIQKEMGETDGYSSALENRLLAKQQQIDKTSASIDKQTQNLQRLGNELNEAGVDTSKLSEESARLSAEMEDLKQKEEEAAEAATKLGTSGAAAIMAYQESIVASGIQEALQTIFEEMQKCADASVQFESALTGVDKTTDMTDSELSDMAAAVKELSTEIPVTTEEMLQIGEVAGQLGIAKENILDFSTTMSMLSTATTMAADEGATMLAQFANITQMDQDKYDELASAIVALGNTYATTEQKIADMSQGIAASANLAGMSEADILGISAAVSSLGIEAQMGATAVSKLISDLMTAVETGDGLEQFARIANMSAEEFTEAWGSNAAGALEKFIVGLSDTERLGASAIVTLTELGITESRMQRTVLSLSNSGDLLSRTIGTANQAWNENVALSEEAAKRYATTASQQVLMQNAFNNLRIAVGDNYTPALRTLYGVTTDVVSGMTAFVETNPALVKSLSAATGVIGAATAGVTAYTAAVKLGQAATALFTGVLGAGTLGTVAAVTLGVAALTAAFVGLASASDNEAAAVREMTEASRAEYFQIQELESEYQKACDTYGETSNEALYLAWQIDELNTSFQNNKQTLSEYVDECNTVNKGLTEMLDSNYKTFQEAGKNEGTTQALTNRLQELASQTDLTVASEEEMKAIIAELNTRVPGLAYSYDGVSSSVMDYAAAVNFAAESQAELQRYEAAQQGISDAVEAKETAAKRVAEATEMQVSAQERLNAAQKAYNDFLAGSNPDSTWGTAGFTSMFSAEYKELMAAQEAYSEYTQQVTDAQAVLDQATAHHEEYAAVLEEFAGSTDEATTSSAELAEAINSTMTEVQALCEAYTEAYNAAYESIAGQYSIWDEAARVVATDTDTITSSISSQTTYWQDYNNNLRSLSDRTGDIKGLSDMLSSFVDGSEESVNAVAGMASATDEELAAMVAAWQGLQEEHDAVAASIAELNTNFTAEMDSLVSSLAQDIRNMNMSSQASAAARATIQAYIDVAEDMLDEVREAYKKVADTAAEALGSPPSYNHGGGGGGFATGTKSAEPGFHLVGENGPELLFFNGGEQVLTAHQTATWADRMQAAQEYTPAGTVDPLETESTRPSVSTSIEVNFQIQGNATPEVIEALDMYGEEFAERVLTVVAEAQVDAVRRSY